MKPEIPLAKPKRETSPKKSLAERLAYAAWRVLNHDNDPFDGKDYNSSNWRILVKEIKKTLNS